MNKIKQPNINNDLVEIQEGLKRINNPKLTMKVSAILKSVGFLINEQKPEPRRMKFTIVPKLKYSKKSPITIDDYNPNTTYYALSQSSLRKGLTKLIREKDGKIYERDRGEWKELPNYLDVTKLKEKYTLETLRNRLLEFQDRHRFNPKYILIKQSQLPDMFKNAPDMRMMSFRDIKLVVKGRGRLKGSKDSKPRLRIFEVYVENQYGQYASTYVVKASTSKEAVDIKNNDLQGSSYIAVGATPRKRGKK